MSIWLKSPISQSSRISGKFRQNFADIGEILAISGKFRPFRGNFANIPEISPIYIHGIYIPTHTHIYTYTHLYMYICTNKLSPMGSSNLPDSPHGGMNGLVCAYMVETCYIICIFYYSINLYFQSFFCNF